MSSIKYSNYLKNELQRINQQINAQQPEIEDNTFSEDFFESLISSDIKFLQNICACSNDL